MIDLKKLRQVIKSQLDRESTENILSSLWHEVNYKHGMITGFGNGWWGDPVALLCEKHGIALPEATRYIEEEMEVKS